jgi:hypothetical protein
MSEQTRPAVALEHPDALRIVTLADRPDLLEDADRLHQDAWDPYLEGAPWDPWERLFDEFVEWQVIVVAPGDQVVGFGHTVPLVWDGTNEDLPLLLNDIIERGWEARRRGESPNTLAALAAVVPESEQNRGISSMILKGMRALAERAALQSLIAPVGPTLKHLYPLTPMERYMHWTREDGAPFDPWVRVHWRLGAEILGVAPITARCTGTVEQWEKWAGLRFPESGLYVVKGALQPVKIDRENDVGCYEDPGIWMRHRIG